MPLRDYVRVPWADGKNFSDRIWENKEKLTRYLTDEISAGFARGDSVDRISRQMRKNFADVSRHAMDRLIYTEGTRVLAEATAAPFADAGITKYKFSTVGDGKVCPACQDIHGKVYEYANRQPGINFPPIHPWCRCTTDPYVEDWDKWMLTGKQ